MKLNGTQFTCSLFIIIIISSVSIQIAFAKEPGFKAILTEKCLKLLSHTTKNQLMYYLKNLKNITKKFQISSVEVEISRIKVTAINDHFESNLLFEPQIGLGYRIKNLSITVGAKYEAEIKPLSAAGFVSLKIYKLSMSSIIRMKNVNGKMDLDLQSCSAIIGHLDFELVEGTNLDKLFNQLISEDFKQNLKTILQQQLCEYIDKELIPSLAKISTNLPTTTPLFDTYFYDYSLTDDPNISQTLFETDHQGNTFTVKSDGVRDDQVPFLSPNISYANYSTSLNPKMVYVFMSNYGLATLMYFLWKNGALDYVISKDKIPIDKAAHLRTDCSETEICASTLYPSLKSLYPNSFVEIIMVPTMAPQVQLEPGQVVIISTSFIECNIRKPNNSKSFLFSTDADLNMTIKTFNLKDYSLNPRIKIADYELRNFKSSSNEISEDSLTLLMAFAKESFLEPDLNKLLKKGITLPKLLNFDMINGSIEILPDLLIAATDLCINCNDKGKNGKTVDVDVAYDNTG